MLGWVWGIFEFSKQFSDSEPCAWVTIYGRDVHTNVSQTICELDPDWRHHINEAKRRGLHCYEKSETAVSPFPLKAAFKKLSRDRRKRFQSNLKNLGYYRSFIDGLYGKGTFGALSAYNKKYLGGADLKKSDNAVKSINTVSSLNTSPALKAAPTPASKSVPITQP